MKPKYLIFNLSNFKFSVHFQFERGTIMALEISHEEAARLRAECNISRQGRIGTAQLLDDNSCGPKSHQVYWEITAEEGNVEKEVWDDIWIDKSDRSKFIDLMVECFIPFTFLNNDDDQYGLWQAPKSFGPKIERECLKAGIRFSWPK